MQKILKLYSRIQMRILGSVLVIGLLSCATLDNYQIVVQSWMGAHQNELILSSWGEPQEIIELTDRWVFLYQDIRRGRAKASHPIIEFTIPRGGLIRPYRAPAQNKRFCQTWFNLSKQTGKVEKITVRGNSCRTTFIAAK